ncbi:MAG: hypothetical protein HYX79_05680 [Chloroflexi bacterium]|nr:hypothetical protein [Chloroflexota bacterium]
MDAILRIIHVVFGIFWAGTVLYASFVLLPVLKSLGPAIERPAVRGLMRVTSPIMSVLSLIVLGTGIAMALRTGLSISALFSTGRGWAIFIAFIAVVIYLIAGFGILLPSGARMDTLGRSIEGRQPAAAESEEMGRLARRISTVERVGSVAVLIATILMPLLRFL